LTAVVFDDVSLTLGGRDILTAVSLEIEDGEFVGVLGANGAGKTTLLRAALGLVAPRTGRISVMGAPATRGNRAVGYMPQTRGLAAASRLTGYDFVASAAGGERWGLPLLTAEERRNVEWALDMVGAGELARRRFAELSGGERQRLLLSQALLGRPRLLLLDEPLISLDPAHQHGVVELVARLQRDMGIAVLFSAHELNPLLNAIDRVLYLGSGRAVLGTVEEVITGPVLSRLYGAPIEVLRIGTRIFVMAGEVDIEREAHRHDHGDGTHDHAHEQDHRHVRL
jgi:zinc/manganese transport system ATP-binding protein